MNYLLLLVLIILYVMLIAEIFKRRDIEMNTKLLWTILIVIAPIIGIIIYLLVGRERK